MTKTTVSNSDAAKMAEIGVLYGHKKSKTHPKMRPFIAMTRNEMEILKPEATMSTLGKAANRIKDIIEKQGILLLVGTNPSAHAAFKKMAAEFSQPFIVTRWLGGLLTNFANIHGRLNYYLNLKSQKESGELAKYTKKEQVQFNKELNKLSIKFDGIIKLNRLPDAVFIADIATHDTAVREARKIGIPVIAIIDTNDDPRLVDLPIIANDHSKNSIDWVVEKITEIVHNK